MTEPKEPAESSTPEAEPVVPAPIEVAPSSTGVVVGDGSEAVEAQPAPGMPEEPDV